MSRGWRRRYPNFAAAYKYANDVASGKQPACLYVRQACERQLVDLEHKDWIYTFDLDRAERVAEFIEKLPHIKGEWASRGELIRLEPWQKFAITTPFGWVYADDLWEDGEQVAWRDMRRYRTIYIEVPRKNTKSTLAAGVGLYMASKDGEAGAEVYSNATTRNQAKIVFNVARQMALRADLGINVRVHNLHHTESASLFEPLHAQGETLDGYNIHCAINDELHAWKKRAVYDVIETATGARKQAMIFNITTAGDHLEGVCYELRGYVISLLNKTRQDDSFFGVIYTIDDADRDHWDQREVWRKANPNWGVSVYPMDVEALARKAREVPSQLNSFLTKRLDVWCNASVAWMDMTRWKACHDPKMQLEDFRGEECWTGDDLASKIDVNSKAILFRRQVGGREHYYCFMRHYLPEAAIVSDRFGQYDGWVRMGAIRKTPGNIVDIDEIERDTLEIAKAHRLKECAVDPGHNSTQYGVHLAQRGLTVVDVRPTILNFSEPMKWLEAWVKEGVWHSNCPVLDWMVSNVVAYRDNKDNLYPRKENSARKIDGVIAVLLAINRMKAAGASSQYQVMFV